MKPGYHVSGSRVGSPGAFKSCGSHWIELVQGPHHGQAVPKDVSEPDRAHVRELLQVDPRDVAVQVAFVKSKARLEKPGEHFIGSRVETPRLF